MHGDMVGFIAFDFIVRLIRAGMMRVSFVICVLCMDFDNPAADVSGFRIPGDVIADFEMCCHIILLKPQSLLFLI
jgi:hypothetical protein